MTLADLAAELRPDPSWCERCGTWHAWRHQDETPAELESTRNRLQSDSEMHRKGA